VKTNAGLLFGVLQHQDWFARSIDTTWLERNVPEILKLGMTIAKPPHVEGLRGRTKASSLNAVSSMSTANVILQPGTMFYVTLSPVGSSESSRYTLSLSSISLNAFPDQLSGVLQTTLGPSPLNFSLSRSLSSSISSSSFDLADPNNPSHIGSPITGKIVELHPIFSSAAGEVKKGEALAVISVMKMESVISASNDGVFLRAGKGIQVGVVIGEGVLLAVIQRQGIRSRL